MAVCACLPWIADNQGYLIIKTYWKHTPEITVGFDLLCQGAQTLPKVTARPPTASRDVTDPRRGEPPPGHVRPPELLHTVHSLLFFSYIFFFGLF